MTDFFRLEYPDPDDYYYSAAGAIAELPTDYAWMNNDPSGVGRAVAAGAQSGGHVEDGTLFIANENDATSAIGNRAHKALAISLDLLDDQLRRPVAVPTRLDGSTGGSTLSSVTILATEMVWLGPVGTEYSSLFQLVDSDGNQIIDSAGNACVVTASNPPPGDAGLKNGFAAVDVQLTISPAIPTGTTYRIYYAKKGSLAEMPRDAITRLAIGGRAEVDGVVKNMLATLHGSSPNWDAAWDSTVYDLAMAGLHERYNRQTAIHGGGQPEPEMSWSYNTYGSGSWIQREGYAPAVYPEVSPGYWKDPMGASWKAIMRYGSSDTRRSSPVGGFVYFGGDYCLGGGALSPFDYTPTVGSFMHVDAAKMWGASALYANAYTYVAYDCDCAVGYDAGDDEVYIDVAGPYRFHDGTDTDIQTGLDIFEVYAMAYGRKALLVQKLKTSTRAYLRRLDGTKPGSIGTYAGKLRWHPMRSYIGDSAADTQRHLGLVNASGLFGAMIMGPRQHGILAGPGQGSSSSPEHALRLISGSNLNLSDTSVLEWGHKTSLVDIDGYASPTITGRLRANGSLTVATLNITSQDIGGNVIFQNAVNFQGVADFFDQADFYSGIGGGGLDITVYDGLALAANKDITLTGTGGITLGAGSDILGGSMALDALRSRSTSTVLCVDNLECTGNLTNALLTSVKGLQHAQGSSQNVSLSSNASVTWAVQQGTVRITITAVAATEAARTLTIDVDGSTLENYSVHYIAIGSSVRFNQGGGAGINSLVVTFNETSATGALCYSTTQGAGVTAGTFTLNEYPNLTLRLIKIPHAFYSGANTYTVFIEVVGTKFIGAIA